MKKMIAMLVMFLMLSGVAFATSYHWDFTNGDDRWDLNTEVLESRGSSSKSSTNTNFADMYFGTQANGYDIYNGEVTAEQHAIHSASFKLDDTDNIVETAKVSLDRWIEHSVDAAGTSEVRSYKAILKTNGKEFVLLELDPSDENQDTTRFNGEAQINEPMKDAELVIEAELYADTIPAGMLVSYSRVWTDNISLELE